MRLYAPCASNYTAGNWYRTLLPFRTAQRLGLADAIIDNFDLKVPNEDERRAVASMYADIVQQFQNFSPSLPLAAKQASEFGAYWRTPDEWSVGPNFVMDTDDDCFNVEPLNPAFKTLGWKVDGKPIPKRHAISIETPHDGVQVLFQDGSSDPKRGIDIEANVRRLNQLRDNMKAMDLITTTTSRSAEYVWRETQHPNIHIFPNCIDFADYPQVELANSDRVRILWQASACHFEDIWPIAGILGKIHKKYPQVDFIIFGAPYPWLLSQLDPDRTQVVRWVKHEQYILRMSMLNHDINLAPLHKSTFNESRSAIRMYESAALWKPAATLAEDTGAFHDEIIEGKTGLLFNTPEEFETKLCALIEDATLRKTIASNAKDWVRTNRDPEVHVPKLIEAYQKLRDARRSITPPPPPLVLPPEPANVIVPAEHADLREREDSSSGAGQ